MIIDTELADNVGIGVSELGTESIKRAFLIRRFEQKLLDLFAQGKLSGTVHTSIGQEFTGIAIADHLTPEDVVVSNHRCHGHYLARTGDVDGLMAEVMGRDTGICGGRGGSQHICAGGVFSNGVQGGMLPVAAGMALSHKWDGTKNIAVAFIGDGTLGEGLVYETLNIASKWSLPLLVVLEDNGVSQSTRQEETLSGDICMRAEAFGIRAFRGDTWNPSTLRDVAGEAIRQIRETGGPAFLHVRTYRLMAHSKGDDDRPGDEVDRFWDLDPLRRFEAEHPDLAAGMIEEAEGLVSAAVRLADEAPPAAVSDVDPGGIREPTWTRTAIDGKDRVVTRIHLALREHLARDDRSFLLGEDIEHPYGGAFKVTKDLSAAHPERVRNTPISEAAIVGLGNGLALAGKHPICEIMFGDFLTLAADQIINHASKFQWMYRDQVTVPLMVRTPMGGGRGYGATHSQCLEKHFLGLPGTRVVAPHPRYDPFLLYKELLESIDRPTLVIENKKSYGDYVTHETVEGFWCEHTDEGLPTTRIRSQAHPDVSILCYGGMLAQVEEAIDRLFEEHEVVAEVVCPTQLYPLDMSPIADSATRAGRLLVVEEGQLFCGLGSEVLARLCEIPGGASVRARRHGARPHPLPCSKSAEERSLPGVDSIVDACLELMAGND